MQTEPKFKVGDRATKQFEVLASVKTNKGYHYRLIDPEFPDEYIHYPESELSHAE